jgi:hypothetical protein
VKLPSRILLLALSCAACGTGARAETGPAPAPAPPPVNPPATVVMSERMVQTMPVCVADGEGMREVQTQYNVLTGDTLIDGRPLSAMYPTDSGYAAAADWFVQNEVLILDGRRYVKYGLPRALGPGDVTRMGEYRGVPVYAQRGAEQDGAVRLLLVRPECIFQPYEGPHYGAVRG